MGWWPSRGVVSHLQAGGSRSEGSVTARVRRPRAVRDCSSSVVEYFFSGRAYVQLIDMGEGGARTVQGERQNH